jgi:hypothetical protein
MRIIAFINDAMAVCEILAHVGEATSQPGIAPARGPPLWEMPDAGRSGFGPQAQPAPENEFDRRLAWQGQLDEEPISLGGERSCLGLSSGPSAAGRVTPGRARVAIPAVSEGRLMPNPPLTTADGDETIRAVPLE